MNMFDFIYEMLQKFGYTHPLHPTLTHLPIGLVLAAFVFGLIAIVFRKPALFSTARHCITFALITVPLAVLLGLMDWQHFYNGDPNPLIIAKIILGFVLMALFSYAILLGRQGEVNTRKFLVISMLCFVVTCLIGFLGGELQYGS